VFSVGVNQRGLPKGLYHSRDSIATNVPLTTMCTQMHFSHFSLSKKQLAHSTERLTTSY